MLSANLGSPIFLFFTVSVVHASHTYIDVRPCVCERCRYDGSRIKSRNDGVSYKAIGLTGHWVMRIERRNFSRIDSRFG
jgi:hypothetical protein